MNFPLLLVDDDALDVKTVRRAFRKAQVSNPLFVADDGQDALDFLRRQGRYEKLPVARTPRPGLILLDLNLPKLDGFGLLRELRADPTLCMLPTVVLTTSGQEEDRRESYRLGVAGYIVKPLDFQRFVDVSRILHEYWEMCELPEATA